MPTEDCAAAKRTAEDNADTAWTNAITAAFNEDPINFAAIIAAGATRAAAQVTIMVEYVSCLLRNANLEDLDESAKAELAADIKAAFCGAES